MVLGRTAHLDRDPHGLVAHIEDIDVSRVRVATDVSRVENLPSRGIRVRRSDSSRKNGFSGQHGVFGCLSKGGSTSGRARISRGVASELLVRLQAEVVVSEGEAGVPDVELGDAVDDLLMEEEEEERGRKR